MVRPAALDKSVGNRQPGSRLSEPGAKRRLPFSKSPGNDDCHLRSVSAITMATPQRADSHTGRLLDSSFITMRPLSSSCESESNFLNNSRASVASTTTGEKQELAKEWFEQALEVVNPARLSFLSTDALYRSYCSYFGNNSNSVLSKASSHGFCAQLQKFFGKAIIQSKQQHSGVRVHGYYGFRFKDCVDTPVHTGENDLACAADNDSISTVSAGEAGRSSPRTDSLADRLEPLCVDLMKFHPQKVIPKQLFEQSKDLLPYPLKPMHKQTTAERLDVKERVSRWRSMLTCRSCGKFEPDPMLLFDHMQTTIECSGYGLSCLLCNKAHRNYSELKRHILGCDGQRHSSIDAAKDDLCERASLASVALSFPSVSDPRMPFRPSDSAKRLFAQTLRMDRQAASKGMRSQGLNSEWFDLPSAPTPERQISGEPAELIVDAAEKEARAEAGCAELPIAKPIGLTRKRASCFENRTDSSHHDVPRLSNIPQGSTSNKVRDYILSLPSVAPPPKKANEHQSTRRR